MSSPPVKYVRFFDFTTFATLNPEKPLPGGSVDAEYNRIKSTSDQTIDRLALIQRDDGALRNGIVTIDSLAQNTLALIGGAGVPRGMWLPNTDYRTKDLVTHLGATYIATVDHHSASVFDTDYGAGKWMIFAAVTPARPEVLDSDFSTLQAANDAAAAAGVTLVISQNWNLTADTVFTVPLRISGGFITTGAYKLTAPQVSGPPIQWLDTAGTGRVEFLNHYSLVPWFCPTDGSVQVGRALNRATGAACGIVGSANDIAGLLDLGVGAQYIIDVTWNLTQSRVNGTPRTDQLRVIGAGVNVIGQTGPGHAIVEITGSQRLSIGMGIRLVTYPVTVNQSTIGILMGISQILPETQNNVIACDIFLRDDPAANNGLGTIAVYNFGAEENTFIATYWSANVGGVWTTQNNGAQFGGINIDAISYQAPLLTSHSLGMTAFTGECFFASIGRRGPGFYLEGTGSFRAQNFYIGSDSGPGTFNDALVIRGNAVTFKWAGIIEGLASIKILGGLLCGDICVDFGGVHDTTKPMLVVDRTVNGVILASNIVLSDDGATGRPIIGTMDGFTDLAHPSNYQFRSTKLRCFTPASTAPRLPLNIAANAGSQLNDIDGGNIAMHQGFSVSIANDAANVTGDGSVFSFNAQACYLNFAADAGAIDPGTGIFTAQHNGVYEFTLRISMHGINSTIHNDANLYLMAGGQQYAVGNRINPGNITAQGTGTIALFGATQISMTAGQTAYMQLVIGGGTKTVTVESGHVSVVYRTCFTGRYVR